MLSGGLLICLLTVITGWLLLRLSRPGYLNISIVCVEEDPLPVWTRVCLACAKRSGGVRSIQSTPKHHRIRGLLGIVGE